jgi:tetratricopeptide (TPR) repeat protein
MNLFRFGLTFAAIQFLAQVSRADIETDRDACLKHNEYTALPYPVMTACSRLIASGRLDSLAMARAYYSRGKAMEKVVGSGRALADYTQAINLDPGLIEAYLKRANLFGGQRDYDAAVADCTAAILLAPRSAAAYECRGRAYENKGDDDLAAADLRKARELRESEFARTKLRPLFLPPRPDTKRGN